MIHADRLEAVQEHSRATPIASVPTPPAGSKDDDELVTDGWQRVPVGAAGLETLVAAELPQAADTRETHSK